MKILVSYRGIPQSPGWATGDFVVEAFRELGHICVPYGTYYQQAHTWLEGRTPYEMLADQYDLYLQMECGDGDRSYSELKNIDATYKATWWFDVALYPERWRRETSAIGSKINFVANKNYADGDMNVYLPYAADKKKHVIYTSFKDGRYNFREGDDFYAADKDIDFLIIGSDRPERRKLYEDVCNVAHNANVQYITSAFRQEYIHYLNRSHFVLNDIAGGGQGLIPMRPFETIAAGSHLITPHGDGVHDLDIPCFEYRNMDELLMLVEELNDRPRPIRFGFQQEFLKNHLYTNRCDKILMSL